jgi:hypothetical protein
MRPSPLHFHPFSAESVHLIVYRAAALADLSFTNCAIEYNYNEADVILQETVFSAGGYRFSGSFG